MFRKYLLLAFVAVSASAQIGTKVQQQGKIYGTWQNNQFGYQMTLILNPNGSGEFDGEPIKYLNQGGTLAITVGSVTTTYTANLQGNSLTLSGGDLDGQVVFARNESSSAIQTGPSTSNYPSTDTKLLGIWSGNGEMISFKADGQCGYLGNTFPYQAIKGRLTLTTGQGNVSFEYAIRGSQLVLTANGNQVTYNKVDESSGKGPAATKGTVAMELVGKWCYMNMTTNSQSERCVTLFADGTYRYHTESSRSVNTESINGGTSSQGDDQGTWFVQGGRLHYISQSQGQGSYHLEKRNHPKNQGDPMIVLDGEWFVTATLREPWRY